MRATRAKRTLAQQVPRLRPNHPRATNPSSHVLHVPSQEQMRNKRRKTTQDNKLAAAQNGTKHGDGWSSDEFKKLLKAVEACGKRWKAVAAAVGSRTATQCEQQYRNLKKAKRLDPISEDTPLREGIFTGFGKPAFKKFAECVAEIDGKRITTVGQLAKLPVDNYGPNLSYLKELTGYKDNDAFKKALAWKAMAVEAIEFWQ